MPRTIIINRPSREPMTWLARKPAIAPTTIHAMKPMGCGPFGSGGLAAEDPDAPVDDDFEQRPADEGDDRRDVEDGAGCVQGVGSENAFEREHEDLAEAEDARDEAVGLTCIEQQENDSEPDD